MFFKYYITLFFILLYTSFSIDVCAQHQKNDKAIANFYKKKAITYLLKNEIDSYQQLSFKEKGLYFYKDSLEKSKHKEHYFISWKDFKNLKKDFENQPLDSIYKQFISNTHYIKVRNNSIPKQNKIKIAISPGHLATNFNEAKYEKKYIEFEDGKTKFYEAELNLTTALLLKKELLKKGFEVFMTRTRTKPDIWGLGFEQWKVKKFDATLKEYLDAGDFSKEQVDWFKNEATEQQIFKYLYVKSELKKRAEVINQFNPDITIAIHYNVDEKNEDWKVPTSKNYMMAFVPGSFLKEELNKPLDKFNFLKLLATDNLKNSIQLSKNFIQSFSKTSCIPIAKMEDAIYLDKFSLPTEKRGVFTRNLAMTRLVHSPILYGEPLYQDHKKIAKSLNLHNPDIPQKRVSKYIIKVVKAYYKSILNYTKKLKSHTKK
ncbi:N-acetylmuramoyl-L-alanine amidase [Tenacibaculum maritimum]|uniref:N-acetylmuramoyl-L-alanine amidase n=1 Tax=Tenacibaculum maritimum TaxID=107401 RepID=UPI001E411C19|nr:N-acetylmuramoyl-L-alanine amidase [Tenacibaculum maritimum]MCD9609970.1 N-acetylmuramoyl-L-alanine amidase [Tenacibaculum maritimum]